METRVPEGLSAGTSGERLAALAALKEAERFPEPDPRYINNHIHSSYSFSPYSPTAAAYMARKNGLCTAGIVDHDSMGGAREFIAAGETIGIPTTVGVEFRVRMDGTPFAGRRLNSPDQTGICYMALHGVPHERIEDVQAYFAPLRARRNARNRAMVENINALLPDLRLRFEEDVLPLSQNHDGGSVTERHLMFALTKRLIAEAGRGNALTARLKALGLALSSKQEALLLDAESPYYEYDLMGMLKSAFVPKVYIPAIDECPAIDEAVRFGREIGGILCYAYLGDVTDSITGDKAAQKFEDAYLEELLGALCDHGVRAVTYMPPRNTRAQLLRLRELCERFSMYQISGEDINSPRQSFVCRAMEDPLFSNLIDAAWALIAHERGVKQIVV